MCWDMDSGFQSQEEVPTNQLRGQLGAAVQSLQWSYAIFWSLSSEQGVLEWGDGFYNGDIKTRKTVLPMELSAEQMGLQRSQQLRELYQTLSAGDGGHQGKRPSAVLSPEDLTDAEWFYLVCMSFVFTPGEGLPGRTFAGDHHIWLCDADYADNKEFTRSLLAKSAGIQTVVCFPRVDGVLEFGVNELVAEDPSLVQHILTFFLVVSKPVCSEQSTFSRRKSNSDDDEGQALTKLDSRGVAPMLVEKIKYSEQCSQFSEDQKAFPCSINLSAPKEEIGFKTNTADISHVVVQAVVSLHHSSNVNGLHQQSDDSYMLDELTHPCQIQVWRQVEEETSEAAHDSMNSSDCISQTFVDNGRLACPTRDERLNQYVQELPECTHSKFKSDAVENDNSHYSRTLSIILCNSLKQKPVDVSRNLSVKTPLASSCDNPAFARWRKGIKCQMQLSEARQKFLKKALFKVAWMYQKHHMTQGKVDDKGILWKQVLDAHGSHVLSEQRGRKKMNEQFMVLRSLVPSLNKLDKASLLGDIIEYLKELKGRVKELETCKELVRRNRYPDVTERTADNYASNGSVASKKCWTIEWNMSTNNEPKSGLQWVLCKDGITDVMATVTDKDVSVEIQCPWRESLLLEIVQAMNDLHFDSQSIKSSMVDGNLKLSLRAKVKTAIGAATEDLKNALQRIVS